LQSRGESIFTKQKFGVLPNWLATMDSSRTLVWEENTNSSATGATRILSRASGISLLYSGISVKQLRLHSFQFIVVKTCNLERQSSLKELQVYPFRNTYFRSKGRL